MSAQRPRLWIPGPTEVREPLAALASEPMIGHRSGAMTELLERIAPHLPHLFGYAEGSGYRACVHSASATGLMESALRGVSGRVLSIVGGAFAKRFADIAETLGREVVRLEVEWSQSVDLDVLTRTLEEQGPFDAITLVSNETSTGVVTPLVELSERVRAVAPDTLLLVDAVTLAAGQPVWTERARLDAVITGSQKALALPPGLALMAASPRYCERAARTEHRGWYLDPLRLLDGQEALKTPTTPAVPQYRALAQQLEDISAGVVEGGGFAQPCDAWVARFERHERMRERTLGWARGHGLGPFAERPEWCSATVTCVSAEGLDVAAFAQGLLGRGFQISNGYGPLKGRTFRLGHMGDHDEVALESLLSAADEVLGELAATR